MGRAQVGRFCGCRVCEGGSFKAFFIAHLSPDYYFLSAVTLCFSDVDIQPRADKINEIASGVKQRELIMGSDNQ